MKLSKEEIRRRNIEMVITALQQLHGEDGVNLKDITKFIASQKRTQQSKVKRMIMTTIMKGVRFGAIEKMGRGSYKLSGSFLNFAQKRSQKSKRKPKVYKKKKPQRSRKKSESDDDKNYYGDDDDGYGDDQDDPSQLHSASVSTTTVKKTIYR